MAESINSAWRVVGPLRWLRTFRRRRAEREVARLEAELREVEKRQAEWAWREQHATDLLTCPGPCQSRTGCLWGVCVIAAVKRMESQSPLESEKRT